MMMISIQCKRAKYVKGINRQRILLLLINLSFLVKSFMIGVHDLQKSLNVGLLFGNSEVVNAEIVLFSLKLMNFFYDFLQCVAFLHHWGFTASPDNRVGECSHEGRHGNPLKWSTDWVSEEVSFGNETQVERGQDTDESPAGSGECDSMESK